MQGCSDAGRGGGRASEVGDQEGEGADAGQADIGGGAGEGDGVALDCVGVVGEGADAEGGVERCAAAGSDEFGVCRLDRRGW